MICKKITPNTFTHEIINSAMQAINHTDCSFSSKKMTSIFESLISFLPYKMQKVKDRWAVLNREYKPVGFYYRGSSGGWYGHASDPYTELNHILINEDQVSFETKDIIGKDICPYKDVLYTRSSVYNMDGKEKEMYTKIIRRCFLLE